MSTRHYHAHGGGWSYDSNDRRAHRAFSIPALVRRAATAIEYRGWAPRFLKAQPPGLSLDNVRPTTGNGGSRPGLWHYGHDDKGHYRRWRIVIVGGRYETTTIAPLDWQARHR